MLSYHCLDRYGSTFSGSRRCLKGFFVLLFASAILAGCKGVSSNPEIAREQFAEMRALPPGLTLAPGYVPQTVPERSAVRFLAQASFGANTADIERVSRDWRWGWLQEQFALPVTRTHWDALKQKQDLWVSQAVDGQPRNLDDAPPLLLENEIWESSITARDQLRRRVAIALSEILVVSLDGLAGNGRTIGLQGAAWLDVLERNAFGNFRTLLEDATLNPAMGYYLNMRGNRKETRNAQGMVLRVPDENYAREVMQLFTIGLLELNPDGSVKRDAQGRALETYRQEDVASLARILTGWDLDVPPADTAMERLRRPMRLYPERHETGASRFLSLDIAAGTDGNMALRMALDHLFQHPNVGPFIGRQLIQRMVTSNPSAGYVSRVSAIFADNGQGVRGDMKAVIDAVLRDPEAMSPANISAPAPTWGKLREPMLRLTQVARAFGLSATEEALWSINNTSDPATRLGQSPLRSPSVFNFFRPGYVPPNTALAARGLVAPEFQITHDTSVAGYVNALQAFLVTPTRGAVFDFSQELALATTPSALVQRIDLRLAHQSLSQATRDEITAAVSSMPGSTDAQKLARVRAAILMVAASPEFIALK